jgi:hypothetical protein
VVCIIKNTATLAGSLFTLHCSQIHIGLPTLSDEDKDVSTTLTTVFYVSLCDNCFDVFSFLSEFHIKQYQNFGLELELFSAAALSSSPF